MIFKKKFEKTDKNAIFFQGCAGESPDLSDGVPSGRGRE
jgi:hypothetical protein